MQEQIQEQIEKMEALLTDTEDTDQEQQQSSLRDMLSKDTDTDTEIELNSMPAFDDKAMEFDLWLDSRLENSFRVSLKGKVIRKGFKSIDNPNIYIWMPEKISLEKELAVLRQLNGFVHCVLIFLPSFHEYITVTSVLPVELNEDVIVIYNKKRQKKIVFISDWQ